MRKIRTLDTLEGIYERMTGKKGSAKDLYVGARCGSSAGRIMIITEALAKLQGTSAVGIAEPGREVRTPAAAATAPSSALQHFERYAELAQKDPRAAGNYYLDHADEILQGRAEAMAAAAGERRYSASEINTALIQALHGEIFNEG